MLPKNLAALGFRLLLVDSLDRPFRKKSPNDMAFPHPQSGKDKYRNEDKPGGRSIVWNLVKRTINITDYRNGQDEVNPANNRTFGGVLHD